MVKLKSLLTRIVTNISTLGNRVSGAEGNISTLGTRVSGAEGNISTLGNRVSGLEEKTSKSIIFKGGSVTVNAAALFTIAQITLPANSRYLVLASTYSQTTLSTQHACYISIMSGTGYTGYGGRSVRVSANNGGGCATWYVIETGDDSVTVAVRCYGYTTSSHTEGGEIIGIPF